MSDCVRKDWRKTVRATIPFLVIQCFQLIGINLPSFQYESSIHYFLTSMTFNIVVLKLMLSNMTKSKFSTFHFEYVYLLIPQVAYFFLGVEEMTEVLITRVCLGMATFEFLFIVFILSR